MDTVGPGWTDAGDIDELNRINGIRGGDNGIEVRAWPRSAWYGLGGALYAIAGIMVALNPIGGAIAPAVLIAVLLIVVGAFLLVGWPAGALWIGGLFLGINLILTGVMYAALALAAPSSRPAVAV